MKRVCKRCQKLKLETEFRRESSSNCGACMDDIRAEAFMINYRQKQINKENSKYYIKNRMKVDPLFKLRMSISSRTRSALKAKKWLKSGNNEALLGANYETVKLHIESKFKLGMHWGNHGAWHIDHIVPLSSAKTEAQLYNLANYQNLSPEWKDVNLSKSAEIPTEIKKLNDPKLDAEFLFNWFFFNADCSMDIARKCSLYTVDFMLNNSFSDIGYWEMVKLDLKKINKVDYSKKDRL